ncbi:MAG TPA: hypothetical protein VF755_05245, partial [Catenuloplanes sp.]
GSICCGPVVDLFRESFGFGPVVGSGLPPSSLTPRPAAAPGTRSGVQVQPVGPAQAPPGVRVAPGRLR